jgi:dipeptidyl aminopeptidase/acylaminoacyl peptidase
VADRSGRGRTNGGAHAAGFADLRFDPVRPVLYAVREAHDPDDDRPETVRNVLVALALDGSDGPGRVIAEGPDFVAAPRPSPDGRWLAWIEWDLPDMPWESTRLRVAALSDDGSPLAARTVAGGRDVSVVEPAWSADGTLHFVSDQTAWWNLYAFDGPGGLDGPARGLAPMAAEIGAPAGTSANPPTGSCRTAASWPSRGRTGATG